jgi:uncharacterized membrane protein
MGLSHLGTVAAAFLASGVEFVEALTIVLALGVTRGWRSSLAGAAAALAVLAGAVALAGAGVAGHAGRDPLRLAVGALVLVFGLQWLRKAVLRSAGVLALHDEDAAFAAEAAAARAAAAESRLGLDWYAATVSFKGVLLEGLEVVFIVVSLAATSGDRAPAAAGAAAALVLVVAAGALVHRPLARVPENLVKLTVGLMLSTFGLFWLVEGLSAFAPAGHAIRWPGGELALPLLFVAWLAAARLATAMLRRTVEAVAA